MEEEVKKAEVKKSEVKILVSKCKGLNQSKPSPQFFVTTKAEFGQTFLGESGKVELNHETGYFNFEFTSSLMLTGSDPMVLDEIAQTPVVVTFNEILPKDKKAKEEKTNTVGKCCIDLLPLLKGETNFSVNLPIHAINQDSQASEQALPVVHVNVSMEKPLLTEEQLENCNLLTLCVENLFSPPESWTPNGQFSYAACLQMPVSNEKETPVMMPSGTFRNPGEKEISDQRKWSCVPMASGSSLYIPNTKIPHHVIEEENGDLRKKEDIEFRELVESQKPRITWNAERRCFFNRQASFSFQQQIAQFRRWPIEVVRIANNAPSHQKAKHKDDDNNTSFHGVAYVDLAPLLYPGVNKISGAFLIQPFSETEMTEKFEKNTILTEENLKTMMDATRSHSSLGHAKGAGGGGGHGKPKVDAKVKQSTVNMGSKIEGDETSTTVVSEAHEYIEARSYVVIEVELEKPLVRKKEIEEIKERISSIIPPRPAYQKKQGGSEKAISDFEEQIGKSANVILEEFRKSFSGIKLSETLNDAEERRKQFFYYLNSTGKYCALKEQIKHFVIKIVREKFLYTSNFKDNEEMQRFTTDLYRFLLDHMHQGLNKYLTSEETAEIPPSIFDSSLLRRFAKEAEDMLNFEEAAKYYQERVVRNRSDANCHIDYGVFCLMIEDFQKAEQCFKDGVSLNQEHLQGLLLSGLCSLTQEEFSEGEQILDATTYLYEDLPLPWTLLGLHFTSVENSIMSERCFNKAEETFGKQRTGEEPNELSDEFSIYIEATQFLLDCNMLQVAERALSHELIRLQEKKSVSYLMLLARLHAKRKDYELALEEVEKAIVLRHQNSDAWAMKGDLNFMLDNLSEASSCYERCLVYEEQPSDLNRVYTRLAMIYLRLEKYEDAKKTHLYLCKHYPSCHTWLGLGVSCCQLNQLDEAEHCLNEANIYDNMNGTVWSYLAYVCLKKKKTNQAEQCYRYSTKLGGAPYDLKKILDSSFQSVF